MTQAIPTELLSVCGVSYGTPSGKELVRSLSFEIASGQIVVISGSNGIGKTTLLRVVLGQCTPTAGKVTLRVAPNEVGLIPQLQNRSFHIPLTILDVVGFSQPGKVLTTEIESVGLMGTEMLHRPWNNASGGERQKALLTLSFLRNSKLLLLDEPTNHLDIQSRGHLGRILVDAARIHHRSALIVSHDSALIDALSKDAQIINLEKFTVN